MKYFNLYAREKKFFVSKSHASVVLQLDIVRMFFFCKFLFILRRGKEGMIPDVFLPVLKATEKGGLFL